MYVHCKRNAWKIWPDHVLSESLYRIETHFRSVEVKTFTFDRENNNTVIKIVLKIIKNQAFILETINTANKMPTDLVG